MNVNRHLDVRRVHRALERAGMVRIRTRGGHAIYRTPEGRVIPIRCHGRHIDRDNLHHQLKLAGVSLSLVLEAY